MRPEDKAEALSPALEANLRQLSEDGLEPERDLWARIDSEIGSGNDSEIGPGRFGAPARRWLLVAAAALVFTTLTGVAWWLSVPSSPQVFELSSTRSLNDLPSATSPELQRAFAGYLEERQQLLHLVGERLHNHPPEVQAEILESLAVIEREMRAIEISIAQPTTEPEAEMHLTDLYELELRLLGVVSERLGGSRGGIRQ